MSALSKSQKAYLAQLAARAFKIRPRVTSAGGRDARPAHPGEDGSDFGEPSASPRRARSSRSVESLGRVARSSRSVESLSRAASRPYHEQLNEWRRAEVVKAVNKNGLRCCSQLDYKDVEAHFLALLGATGKAFNAHVRAATEPRRQAEWKLVEACRLGGFHLAYAEAICQRQFHCVLADATERQIWTIKYTIDARARAKKQKEQVAA